MNPNTASMITFIDLEAPRKIEFVLRALITPQAVDSAITAHQNLEIDI